MAADAKDPQEQPTPQSDVIEGSAVEKTTESEPAQDNTTQQAQAAATDADTVEIEVVKAHGHKGIWFVTLINLLILIAIIAGGYWYWLNYLKVERVNPQVEQLEQRYSQLQSSLEAVQAQVGDTQSALSASQAELATLQQHDSDAEASLSQLAQQVELNQLSNAGLAKRIADVAGRRPSDWLLAEADYLVKLAGKKLYLEQDVQSAIMLLKSADVRIADLADTSLLPIRALLAKDIQALQQVNQVASTSIALSLSALIAQVDTLPLDTLKLPDPVEAEEASEVSADVANWKANLQASWDAIVKDFISVEKRTTAVTPFMSGQQQWLAREQLKYALLNAQQAILQDEPELYVQALQTSLDTVVTHYQLDNVGVEAYIQSIQDLIAVDTRKTLPTQLDSQVPLAEVIEARIQTLFAGSN